MNMEKTVFQPLYRQTEVLLTQALKAGEWPPGGLIPSEQELALRFGVSQGTIRKAIESLRADKLLVRRQGRGTYVASHREEAAQFRFLKLRPDERPPHALRSEFLDCTRLKAGQDLARALDLQASAVIVRVRRLLWEREQPVVYEEINLPGHRFKGLSAERLSAYQGPLYGLFESEFGVRMVGGEEKLKAVIGPPEICQALRVPAGSPLLYVDRVTVSYDQAPVEARRAHYVTREHHYAARL